MQHKKLYDYQQSAIDSVVEYWAGGGGSALVEMPTGCHARGTRVLMADGSLKAVEDVRVGDSLMGPDSKPRKVLRLHRGREQMYRIATRCGESFVVNAGHILHLQSTNEGKIHACSFTGKEFIDISVADYIQRTKTFKHIHKLTKPGLIYFPHRRAPDLDPWFLGALLGDGHLGRNGLSLTSADKIIRQLGTIYGGIWNCRCREICKPNNAAMALYFKDEETSKKRKRGDNPLEAELDRLGLLNVVSAEKFVPDRYKLGSEITRLRLLAGLMDTDGSLGNGVFDYVSKSKDLADDVCFIARSLGLKCTSPKIKVVPPKKGNAGGSYWRVCISGDIDRIPTILPRKRAKPRQQKKNPLKTGFTVMPAGPDSYYGFTLSDDHLYMTSDFIIHHNSGKSLTMAELMRRLHVDHGGTRIILLTHVQELVEQDAQEIQEVWPDAPIGIYSAGLGRRDGGAPIVFASVQSVHKNIDAVGERDVVLIDEAHLLSRRDDGQYQQVLKQLATKNAHMRLAGFTATPYRTDSGLLTEGWRNTPPLFDEIVYRIDPLTLINRGILCPLLPYAPHTRLDVTGVRKQGGEYVAKELQAAVDKADISRAAIEETCEAGADRDGWMVFASGVEHAQHLRDMLREKGIDCEMILGDTPKAERKDIIERFKARQLRCVVGNNVLTTGFNARHVSLLSILRPTASKGLHTQIMGRGLRTFPGKNDCLVLDFAGNTMRHGHLDMIDGSKADGAPGTAPAKECKSCGMINHASAKTCKGCGAEFPIVEQIKFAAHSSGAAIFSTQDEPVWYDVDNIIARPHTNKEGVRSIRLDYVCGVRTISHWISLESEKAGGMARRWWERNSYSGVSPRTVDDGLAAIDDLRIPGRIMTMKDGKYTRILNWDYSVPPGKVITIQKLVRPAHQFQRVSFNVGDF